MAIYIMDTSKMAEETGSDSKFSPKINTIMDTSKTISSMAKDSIIGTKTNTFLDSSKMAQKLLAH